MYTQFDKFCYISWKVTYSNVNKNRIMGDFNLLFHIFRTFYKGFTT